MDETYPENQKENWDNFYRCIVNIPITGEITVKASNKREAEQKVASMRIYDFLAYAAPWETGKYDIVISSVCSKKQEKKNKEREKERKQKISELKSKVKAFQVTKYDPDVAFDELRYLFGPFAFYILRTNIDRPLYDNTFLSGGDLERKIRDITKYEGSEGVILYLGGIELIAKYYIVDEKLNRPRNITYNDLIRLKEKLIKNIDDYEKEQENDN